MCYIAAMRLFLGLGLIGLLFVGFTFTAISDGKPRDAAESGAVGLVMLGASAFFGRRYVFKAERRTRVSDLLRRDPKSRG
jgi:hypothetical protein